MMNRSERTLRPVSSTVLTVAMILTATGCHSLHPTVTPLNYGSVFVGMTGSMNVSWRNDDNHVVVLNGYTAPNAPFSVTAPLPMVGGNVVRGATTPPLTIQFAPTAVGNFRDTVSAVPAGADTAEFARLNGTGIGHAIAGQGFGIAGGDFNANSILDFGTVNVGARPTLKFRLLNGSNVALNLTARPQLAGPFAVTAPAQPIAVAVPVNALIPTRVRTTVTFSPTAPGTFLDYLVFTDAANPGYRLTLVVKGIAVRPPPPPPGGGGAGGEGEGH